MSRVVNCLITGTSFTCTPAYFNKKIEDYGGIENLKSFFVTKKVKALIERGYSVQEIRNILDVDTSELQDANSQQIKDIMTYYKSKSKSISKRLTPNLSMHKSDLEVVKFINNIRNYE